MVLACFGSSNPLHSCKTTIAYLHFLPMGFYISVSCLQERVRVRLTVGRAIIFLCFVLVLDACFQFFSGHNLLGYPLQGDSVTGMFHPKQRLGLFLAILAPFFIHFLWKRGWSLILILMSALPYLFVILVSLKRNSWMMLFIGLIIFAFIECKGSFRKIFQDSWCQQVLLFFWLCQHYSLQVPPSPNRWNTRMDYLAEMLR